LKNNLSTYFKKKFRLVILNETSLEEKAVFKISTGGIIWRSLLAFFSIFLICFCIIVYSPVKQYIPGKASNLVQKNLISLSIKSDSLERVLSIQSLYLKNFEAILNGDSSVLYYSDDTTGVFTETELSLSVSKEDSLLRQRVEREDLGSLNNNIKKERSFFLFYPPFDGMISDSFNLYNNHFAIDLVAKKGTKIKSISQGTVIVSDWNPESGYVIGVQHENNFISFYKHCSRLLKRVGDFVEMGEHIAIIGNSGELSTGPHLHLELWKGGTPLNPADYISF